MKREDVKAARKHQTTKPKSVHSKLDAKKREKPIERSGGKQKTTGHPQRASNPSDVLWNLFGKPLNIDATRLVEESWKETYSPELARLHKRKRKQHAE